jgi:lactate dehydrogenase-like 2-hydroxyacid dehydrogenase
MKIAVLRADGPFTNHLVDRMRATFAAHDLVVVDDRSAVPADAEILFMTGRFGRDEIAALPTLALIQTTSAGFE